METPKGVSQTVPDDSYSIKDLIKKYASGLDPGISKLPNHNGEDDEVDFDDVDYASEARQDYADVHDTLRVAADRQKRLLEQMQERKKASEKKDEKREDEEDPAKPRDDENTRKSRKYQKPKEATEEPND